MRKILPALLVGAFVVVTLGIDSWAALTIGSTGRSLAAILADWAVLATTAIFVTVALAGGIYKCMALSKVREAWGDREYRRVLMLWVLLLVAWSQSITFEATFYGTMYGDAAAARQAQTDYAADVKAEKAQIEERLAHSATKRSPDEVQRDIDRRLSKVIDDRTLGQLTKDCTATQRYDYRYCAQVLTLRGELASAKKIAEDEGRLKEIRDGKAWVTRVGDAHPGAAVIARFVSWVTSRDINAKSVLDVLTLLGLAMVQLFSTVLPYAVFSYGPRRARSAASAKPDEKVSGKQDRGIAGKADASDEKPVGIPAGEVTVAGVDGGRKPSPVPRFFPANDSLSRLNLLSSTGLTGPDDVGTFIAQYIEFGGKGAEALAADVYRVYTGVVGLGLAHNAQAFLKAFRKCLPEGVKRRKVSGVIRYEGLQLNAAAQQILAELRKEKHTLKVAA
jgi:hypothetical protein